MLGILFVFVALLFVFGAGALFFKVATEPMANARAIALTGVIFLVSIGSLIGAFFVHPIDAGFVGVVTSFGKVQPETLKPGLNFIAPFVNNVTDVDTRVRGVPFENLAAASKEYQDVIVTGTLNVHIDQNKAVDLYQKVGLDYDQKLVIPFFANAIKEVVPQYAIGDVLAHREDIRRLAVEKLSSKLATYGITVDDVAIANIDFSEQYKQAIEAKQVAEQQVLTERQILEQRRIQAEQVRVSAQGQADAVLIAAEAQAKANDLLQLPLTDALIQYTLVQKLGGDIKVIILPQGQSFILDPKALVPSE